ncbi:MAG: hypothetical protein WBP13_12460 [Methylophilaceae bacterium]
MSMSPPWLKYPKIPLGSLGWRMGAGETYWYDFQDWFALQSEHARQVFAGQFPEPLDWQGFYERSMQHHSQRVR